MNKKKLMMGIIVAAVAVALIVGFVFLWKDYQKQRKAEQEKEALKTAPGGHAVDDNLYAHFSGDCYIFREKDDTLVEISMVAMDGFQVEDSFEGTLSVLGYEHSEDGFIEGTPLVSKVGDFYTVLDKKTCRHNETDEDGNNKMVTHFTDYEFTYYVYPQKPEFLAVLIYEHLKDDYYVGVLATSEAEAKEYYQWFQENEP